MTSTPEDDIERFNRWATTYDRSIVQRLYFGPVHSQMIDLLQQGRFTELPRSILDIGCGTGRLLRAASRRWPEAQLFGVDPAERMISEAKRLSPRAMFTIAGAESLPIPNESIDLVLSSLSFHHWTDQAKGLQEIGRVLCSRGLFCLADHTFLLANLVHEKAKGRNQIRALIEGANFTVIAHRRLWIRFVLITLAQKQTYRDYRYDSPANTEKR